MKAGNLYPQIAEASLDKPELFAERVLEILCQTFPIKAASLYSYEPQSGVLILRGQSRLDYQLYRSFELPLETPVGECVLRNEIVTYPDIRQHEFYRDKQLIKDFGLKSFLAVPLPSTPCVTPESTSPIGVICVYPKQARHIESVAKALKEIAPFIALLYNASLDQLKIRLREELVRKAGYSHEMGGLLHRIVHTFKDLVHVEGASIFLYDERNGFLRLRATTGITHGIPKTVHYRSDSADPTYRCLTENKVLILDQKDFKFDSAIPLEKTDNPRLNCLINPIQEAAVQFQRDHGVLGVLRAFNHVLTHGGVSHHTTFGWEEIKLISFFVELTAVMAHFMKKGDNAKDDFERRMHGAKNNLQATHFTLELMEMADIPLPPYMERGSITNSIAFLEDIRAQIQRLDLRQALVIEDVAIFPDILSKIPQIVRRTADTYRVGSFEITNLKGAGFDKLPKVAANKDALLSVFRNLAENAVKYCEPNKRRHKLQFSHSVEAGMLQVFVANDGVKIPDKDRDLIFVEGFRTDDAMARHPSSNGLGLSDSRELMQKMNGTLSYLSKEPITTFLVEIPLKV